MKANLNLGSISGIKIKIHWTFFFLLIWIIFSEIKAGGTIESILYNMAFIVALFACVVLHELGHALTAQRFGVKTKKITLLPIGGMASLDKIPEQPRQEFLVAIAGPLVNVFIALLLYFIVPVSKYLDLIINEAINVFKAFTLQNFLFYLFVVNVAMVFFNLIPAFPMDGGRILRALLAAKINRVKATQIATNVGQAFAVLFALLGLLYNPFLIIIALFIFIGAYGENKMVQHLALLKGHTVEESMLTNITTFSLEDTLDDVVKTILSGTETNFIITNNDKIEGVIYHRDIIENSNNRKAFVKDIINRSFKTIDMKEDLKNAYRLIQSEKRPFFPVTNNGKLAGAIDLINLNEFILLQAKLEF